MKNLAKLLILLVLVSACAKDPKPVSYYRQHEPERKQLVEKFRDNPGKYREDGDVINAMQAEQQLQTERIMRYDPPKVISKGIGDIKFKPYNP